MSFQEDLRQRTDDPETADTDVVTPSLAAPDLPEQAAAPAQPAERMVRVFDQYGREQAIPLSAWREQLLPAALEGSQGNPEQLGAVLSDALELGCAADILEAARQFADTDPLPERGTVLYAAALRESGDPAASEVFLRGALDRLPPSGLLLLNLAQAQFRLGQVEASDETVWQALQTDPNAPQPLSWYAQRARDDAERAGATGETLDAAWLAAVERIASLPGAWLPFTWIAKAALNRNDLPAAAALYDTAIARANRPVPAALLQSISGDLGQHGHLAEALRLSLPLYEPATHGLAVGNNIIKLLADTGDLDQASARVDELHSFRRPDWQPTLQYWEADLQQRRTGQPASQDPQQAQPQLSLLGFEGPVWLSEGSPARSLYPSVGSGRARILFLGSSVTFPEGEDPQAYQPQLPDTAGRLSRALPLFLSEGSTLLLGLDGVDLVPWASHGGFALMGSEWPHADAAAIAAETRAQFAVTTHLRLLTNNPSSTQTAAEPTTLPEAQIVLTVLRVTPVAAPVEGAPRATSEVLASAEVPVRWSDVQTAVVGAWSQLALALVRVAGDNPNPLAPHRYGLPRGNDLGTYLLRLEQCLAVRCAATTSAAPALFGEREILRGEIELALRYPASLPCRLILLETLTRLKPLQPSLVAEQKEAVTQLMESHPIADPDAHRLLTDALAALFTPA